MAVDSIFLIYWAIKEDIQNSRVKTSGSDVDNMKQERWNWICSMFSFMLKQIGEF